jgi:hypothetical protein
MAVLLGSGIPSIKANLASFVRASACYISRSEAFAIFSQLNVLDKFQECQERTASRPVASHRSQTLYFPPPRLEQPVIRKYNGVSQQRPYQKEASE